MDEYLKICTFNVRNDNLVEGLTEEKIIKTYESLFDLEEIDILATQEMIASTLKVLKENLPDYHQVGKSRYGNRHMTQKVRPLRIYNEYATIFTQLPVLKQNTIALPWFPSTLKDLFQGIFKYRSITPRVLTEIIIDMEQYGRVRLLNTHLDCHMNTVRKKQLDFLYHYIEQSNLPVILLGDFNSNLKNKLFANFVKKLEKIGIHRLEYNKKTFRKSKKDMAIDHIFLPEMFEVKEFGIIDKKGMEEYSDHYPLYVVVKIKNQNEEIEKDIEKDQE